MYFSRTSGSAASNASDCASGRVMVNETPLQWQCAGNNSFRIIVPSSTGHSNGSKSLASLFHLHRGRNFAPTVGNHALNPPSTVASTHS